MVSSISKSDYQLHCLISYEILNKVCIFIESLFSSVKMKLLIFYEGCCEVKIARVKKHLAQCQAHS